MGDTSRSAPMSRDPEETLLRASLSRCFSPSHVTAVGWGATHDAPDSREASLLLSLPSAFYALKAGQTCFEISSYLHGWTGTSPCLRVLGTHILFLASVASADTETGTICSHALLHIHRTTERAEESGTQMSVSPLCRQGNRGSEVLPLWSLGLDKCSRITCLAAAPESLGTTVLGP